MRVSAQEAPPPRRPFSTTGCTPLIAFPGFFPTASIFLFFATSHSGGNPKENGIYMASVDNQETHFIVATDSAAQYASGYLLFRSGSALDGTKLRSGIRQAVRISSPSQSTTSATTPVYGRSIFSVSQNGLLVYQAGDTAIRACALPGSIGPARKLSAVNDRENTTIDLRLSPDGKRLAYGGPLAYGSLT